MDKEEIIQEQEDTKKLVEEVLEEDIRARNNDLWLLLMVWTKKQQIRLDIPYSQIKDMALPESVNRVRRTIQNTEGRWLPTDPMVLLHRQFKEEVIRNYYRGNPFMLESFQKLKYGVK